MWVPVPPDEMLILKRWYLASFENGQMPVIEERLRSGDQVSVLSG